MFPERTAVSSPAEMTSIPKMMSMPGTAEPIGIGASAASISPIEIVWLVGMCAYALFFIVAYIKCRREFKMSLPIENDFITRWLQEHPMWRPVPIRQDKGMTRNLPFVGLCCLERLI
jgi:hypothetical protein